MKKTSKKIIFIGMICAAIFILFSCTEMPRGVGDGSNDDAVAQIDETQAASERSTAAITGWRKVYGYAYFMGGGDTGYADGEGIWHMGRNPTSKGFPLYLWKDNGWRKDPSRYAYAHKVAPFEWDKRFWFADNPSSSNDYGNIYIGNFGNWTKIKGPPVGVLNPSTGRWIMAGAAEITGEGYIIDSAQYKLWRYVSGKWYDTGKRGMKVSAYGSNVWLVDGNNRIYHSDNGARTWRSISGRAREIACGPRGVFHIGMDGRPGAYSMYQWTGTGWRKIPGAAQSIVVGRSRVWHSNGNGEMFVSTN